MIKTLLIMILGFTVVILVAVIALLSPHLISSAYHLIASW